MTAAAVIRISIFCEDRGHELFLEELLRRVARDYGLVVEIDFRSASGGLGRAVSEFEAYQIAVKKGRVVGTPDLLMVVIDGNNAGWQTRRSEIIRAIEPGVFPRSVVGCPDPYIERWCLVDDEALRKIGAVPPSDAPVYRKGARAAYKKALKRALVAGGIEIAIDEMEVAPDIVGHMDLRPRRVVDASLRAFLRDLQAAFKALAGHR